MVHSVISNIAENYKQSINSTMVEQIFYQLLKKRQIELIKENDEIRLIPLSLDSLSISESTCKIISSLTHIYNNKFFIRIYHIPYCILPQNTLYKNLYYTKYPYYFDYIKIPICKICKYERLCPGVVKEVFTKIKKRIKPLIDIPIEITIEITSKCNLQCKICLSNKKEHREVPFSRIKDIVKEAKSMGVEAIRITGGEPLMRKDILDILKYIKKEGFYLILNTNGSLLDDKIIKEIEKYVDNILVSLQGYNTHTESLLTGVEKIFKHKIMNLRRLALSKIKMVRVATIASQILKEHINKYYVLFKILGIKNWVVIRPIIMNNKKPPYVYNLSKQDMIEIIRKISLFRGFGINVNIGNAIPFCIVKENNKKVMFWSNSLTEGFDSLVFDVRGFYKPGYALGVNLGDSLKKALSHPFLKKIKSLEYLPKKCLECEHLKNCLGGSRSSAKEIYKDYFALDPWIEDNIYTE